MSGTPAARAVPFFETPRDPSLVRRLVVITYHFPPSRAVGGRRWEMMARHAVERGWAVDVITREPDPDELAAGSDRLARLPHGVRVFGVPERELVLEAVAGRLWNWLKAMNRGSVEVGPRAPDGVAPAHPRAQWVAREDVRFHGGLGDLRRAFHAWAAIERSRDLASRMAVIAASLRPARDGAVITSGPPHMIHMAGVRLARELDIGFVMDMRDPWSLVEMIEPSVASPIGLALARHYERSAVRAATLIAANTQLARDAMAELYPARARDIITVMNGTDDDPVPCVAAPDRFSVAHVGSLYIDRDPRPLIRAAARVAREMDLTPEEFTLEFVGDVQLAGATSIAEAAAAEGIGAFVRHHPLCGPAEAMQFMARAAMLVTIAGQNLTAIPAKTFECMKFDAWLLALCPRGSATDILLRDVPADVCEPSDVEGMAAALRRRISRFRAGERPVTADPEGRFSRRRQADLLFDALEERLHG